MENYYQLKRKEEIFSRLDFNAFNVLTRLSILPANCKSFLVSLGIENDKVVLPVMLRKGALNTFDIFEDRYYERDISVNVFIPDERIIRDVKYNDKTTKNYFDVPVLITVNVAPYKECDECEHDKTADLCAFFYDRLRVKVGLDAFHNQIKLRNNQQTNKIEIYIDEVNN